MTRPFDITHIFAPTDLSDSDIPALGYARLLADRFTAKLTVMYTDPIAYPVDLAGPSQALFVAPPADHEKKLRAAVEEHAAKAIVGGRYDIYVTVGQPVAAILAGAEDRKADLIVMATHGRRGWRRALLGSVTEGVLHASRCPVLTVATQIPRPGPQPAAITNIVCPINFSDVARDSLQAAVRLAEVFRARLTVVHVVEPQNAIDPLADEEKVRLWAAADVQGVYSCRELVMRGGAAERVLDCADDIGADLLVIGAQQRLFRDTTVIGTTTERLIRFAGCPVLVVAREPVRRQETVEQETAAATPVGG